MELPQPGPYGEARKPMHNFLSLHNDPSIHQPNPDARPPSSPGMYLKTHDFLQVSKGNFISEAKNESPSVEKHQSMEHVLPGGIGTYSISHIPNFSQGIVKPERNVCPVVYSCNKDGKVETIRSAPNGCNSMINGGAFTLWDESSMKEKVAQQAARGETAEKPGQWSSERAAPYAGNASGGFGVPVPPANKLQPGQGFVEKMKSTKGGVEEEEDEEEEEELLKKECSSHRVDGGVGGGKGDAKGVDQKAATPRSKHSATEQRRRSKINDRFQILRQLIPHSDQKRDKASFLLEVIEYIQFLQEKVHKYESTYPGWNQDGVKKPVPWKNGQGSGETMGDHAHVMKNGPVGGLLFGRKFDDNSIAVPSSVLAAAQLPMEPENAVTGVPQNHPSLVAKVVPLSLLQQQSIHPSSFVRGAGGLAQVPQRLMPDVENMAPQWHRQSTVENDNLREQEEMVIEGGTIRISSVYSRGLMSSLTHALQSSGIDLSQANVSVQIDIGKRAHRPTTSCGKDQEEPSSSHRAMAHSRVASSGEDSDPAQKRARLDSSQ